MDRQQRVKQLLSKPAIIGWVAIGKFLWELIKGLSTLDFAMNGISEIWQFLSTPRGNILVLVAGLLLILYAVLKPAPHKAKQLKSSIFPYIRTVSASPVIDAEEEFLSVSIYFPGCVNQIGLTLEGELIVEGTELPMQGAKTIKLLREGVSRIYDWHVPLTKSLLKLVKDKVETNKPVKVVARLWDRDAKERYIWETEEWTTLLLTRVN